MELKGIVKDIALMAKTEKKKIVLPEALDKRVLEAAKICIDENISDIVLIGNKDEIAKVCQEENIELDFSKVEIEDVNLSDKKEKYVEKFYELRKAKGVTLDDARKAVSDNVYFGTMMVKMGDADGMVSGAIHSTADTLRPALQIIKQAEGVNTVSSFFIIESPNKELGKDGKFIFSDCGLIEFPTEEQMVDIIFSSAKSFTQLIDRGPNVAMLSYSTKGSAKGEAIDKINRVLEKVKSIDASLNIDGELQLDAAIIPEVAKLKAGASDVAGKANVLIFPNLEAGNIAYKVAQRFGNAVALGPITQGLAKPVNDLSRGCSAYDIVGAIAITCVQAQNSK